MLHPAVVMHCVYSLGQAEIQHGSDCLGIHKCHIGQQHPRDHPHSLLEASALCLDQPFIILARLSSRLQNSFPVSQRPPALALTSFFVISRIVDFKAFLLPPGYRCSFLAGISLLLGVFLKHHGFLYCFCDRIHLHPSFSLFLQNLPPI